LIDPLWLALVAVGAEAVLVVILIVRAFRAEEEERADQAPLTSEDEPRNETQPEGRPALGFGRSAWDIASLSVLLAFTVGVAATAISYGTFWPWGLLFTAFGLALAAFLTIWWRWPG
jgi:fatty acid desaturase